MHSLYIPVINSHAVHSELYKISHNVDVSLYGYGSEDEFDNLKHGDSSVNITGHINILEQLESDENLSVDSDYEAGGDA